MDNSVVENLNLSTPIGLDIEAVCKECSEKENPPQVFLLSSRPVGSLLAVSTIFLEEGQQLPCPGLPLAGAAFDPNWGFSRAEVCVDAFGQTRFHLPKIHQDLLNSGDTHGYRLCVVESDEIPDVIAQLANIRSALASCGSAAKTGAQAETLVLGL